jgi:hypothetical protein
MVVGNGLELVMTRWSETPIFHTMPLTDGDILVYVGEWKLARKEPLRRQYALERDRELSGCVRDKIQSDEKSFLRLLPNEEG